MCIAKASAINSFSFAEFSDNREETFAKRSKALDTA